jgi:predicted NUDIX family NTP pyrophosphohydrolase
MPKESAGLLCFRRSKGALEVLLAHPGGPFWASRDLGAWSIPKGEIEPGEPLLDAARREFHEETGFRVDGPFVPLAPLRQRGGKTVHAWAVEGDADPSQLASGTFRLEWPPRSGRYADFPEVDRAAWFVVSEARRRILPGQAGFLDELEGLLEAPSR